MVRRCVCPLDDEGRGPTKSTCTCVNFCFGTGMACTVVCSCLVTFPRAHCWQYLLQAATSEASPGHTHLLLIMRLVAHMPACARFCTLLKTARRHATGTRGRSVPSERSQYSSTPPVSTVCTLRRLLSCCVSPQSCWACAISTRSRCPPSAGRTTAAGLESTSATTLSRPGTRFISEVNSAMKLSCHCWRGVHRITGVRRRTGACGHSPARSGNPLTPIGSV